MKVYKMEVVIIDFDDDGAEEIKGLLENAKYLTSVSVLDIQSRDIGEWDDDNPLNYHSTFSDEVERLFGARSFEAGDIVDWVGEKCVVMSIEGDRCSIRNVARGIGIQVSQKELGIEN